MQSTEISIQGDKKQEHCTYKCQDRKNDVKLVQILKLGLTCNIGQLIIAVNKKGREMMNLSSNSITTVEI